LYQTEELDNSLDKWIDKWGFIVQNDNELTKVGARIALRQLDVIVAYNFKHRLQRGKGTVENKGDPEIESLDILL
jgi:hypothetical protein